MWPASLRVSYKPESSSLLLGVASSPSPPYRQRTSRRNSRANTQTLPRLLHFCSFGTTARLALCSLREAGSQVLLPLAGRPYHCHNPRLDGLQKSRPEIQKFGKFGIYVGKFCSEVVKF